MIISFVISTLGTIPNGQLSGLEDLEIGGQTETIQATDFVKIYQNTENSPGNKGDLFSFGFE